MKDEYDFKDRVKLLMYQRMNERYILAQIDEGLCFARTLSSPRIDIYFDPNYFNQVKGRLITSYHLAHNNRFVLTGTLAVEIAEGIEGLIGFIDGTGIVPGLTTLAVAKRISQKLLVKKNEVQSDLLDNLKK